MLFKAIARVRQLWLARRIHHVRHCMQRERTLHRQYMSHLRAELDALELRHGLLHADAANGVQEAAP